MPKILIADDNEDMLDTLERIFGLYEFQVVKAINGIEAVDLTKSECPDVVLLDGMMPEMDGFEACKLIKQEETTNHIPVVFLTANFMELRDRIKGLELGADDYLLKPFNSKELVARIKSILNRSAMIKQLKKVNNELVQQNNIMEKELEHVLEQTNYNFSVTDPLTGLLNFDFFKVRFKEEMLRAHRYKNDLSIIAIKLENGEKVFDALGKHIFNFFIIKLANFILTKTRAIDSVSYKDFVFILLLTQTELQAAENKAKTIISSLSDYEYIDDQTMDSLRFSRKKVNDLFKVQFKYTCLSFTEDEKENSTIEGVLSTIEHRLTKNEHVVQ